MAKVYIRLKTTDPEYNLAAEQYVFDSLPRGNDYFMLWQNDRAVIIGRHQNTIEEINEDYISKTACAS
jgi:lipoate-protein ligase A